METDLNALQSPGEKSAAALITVGPDCLPPLLEALIDRPESAWLREGAHHVFHEFAKRELGERAAPMLAAIEHSATVERTPIAAEALLKTLRAGD